MAPPLPKISIPKFQLGGWRTIAVQAVVALAVVGFAWSISTTNIGAQEFAVRQVYFGPGQGIQERVYNSGVHLVIPGYERFHTFPKTLNVIEFNDDQLQSSAEAVQAPSIHIQTSEGYRVKVDISVLYRIVNPHQVMTAVGPGTAFITALVRPRAETALRQTLGKLDAEQFYKGSLRREQSWAAREMMNRELEPNGISIWAVLVRQYSYDERYQAAIETRKIQDQTVFKNRAEALAAAEEAEKNRVLAAGQAIVDVETRRGSTEVQKIKADADLFARKRNAEGDLLVALAEAEAQRLQNDALSAAGASNIVGLDMAEAIRNTKVIVVPTDGSSGMNPLDLNRLIQGW